MKSWAFYSASIFISTPCFFFSSFFFLLLKNASNFISLQVPSLILDPFILFFIIRHLNIQHICNSLFLRTNLDFRHGMQPLFVVGIISPLCLIILCQLLIQVQFEFLSGSGFRFSFGRSGSLSESDWPPWLFGLRPTSHWLGTYVIHLLSSSRFGGWCHLPRLPVGHNLFFHKDCKNNVRKK